MEIPMHKPMNILGLAAVVRRLWRSPHHWPQRNSKPSPEWQAPTAKPSPQQQADMDKWLQTRRRPISSSQPMRRPTTGRFQP